MIGLVGRIFMLDLIVFEFIVDLVGLIGRIFMLELIMLLGRILSTILILIGLEAGIIISSIDRGLFLGDGE
jgi:hypothetical protein